MSSVALEKLRMTGAGRAIAVLTSGGDAQGTVNCSMYLNLRRANDLYYCLLQDSGHAIPASQDRSAHVLVQCSVLMFAVEQCVLIKQEMLH